MNTSTKWYQNIKLDRWSWLRIAIAVGLIIGAHAWGVFMGMERGSHGDRYERGDYKKDHERWDKHHSEDRREPMPMPSSPSRSSSSSPSHMDMSMADMAKMLDGKTGDALDRAFLQGMIPHHQGAVDMAKSLTNAKHPELRKMGEEIITAQNKEIEQMKKWMIEWGYASTGSAAIGNMNPQDEMMRSHCREMPEMSGCEKYR